MRKRDGAFLGRVVGTWRHAAKGGGITMARSCTTRPCSNGLDHHPTTSLGCRDMDSLEALLNVARGTAVQQVSQAQQQLRLPPIEQDSRVLLQIQQLQPMSGRSEMESLAALLQAANGPGANQAQESLQGQTQQALKEPESGALRTIEQLQQIQNEQLAQAQHVQAEQLEIALMQVHKIR